MAQHRWHLPALGEVHRMKKGSRGGRAGRCCSVCAFVCVCWGGWEQWSEDTLPLPGAEEAETQMSENKNSPERGGQNLLISQLCTVKQFVRAWVSNWLRTLTSLHTFCPASLDICCENYDPGCADGMRLKDCHAFISSVFIPCELCCYYFE